MAEMDWSPRPEPKAGFARRVDVAIYDPEAASAKGRYRVMPNLQCDQIQYREGASPPTARFRYVLDDRARAMGWPTQFETILRLHDKADPNPDDPGAPKPEKASRYVVKTDDRIVVLLRDGDDPKARPAVLFDGFTQSPQVDVSGKGQQVTFVAAGVASRCWDEPITWRLTRQDEDHAVWTDKPVVFNASVLNDPHFGNRARSAKVTNGGRDEQDFPPFVDDRDAEWPWSLSDAAKYLMGAHNPEEEFVDNPDFDILAALLKSRRPKGDAEYFDPSDSETYEETDITVPEYDATGKPWPVALAGLLDHHGFAMAFRCEADENGEPWNHLEIYRKDGSGPYDPKSIPFQATGGLLDPSRQAVGAMAVTRDYQSAFNGVVVLGPPPLVEVCVVLAPAFVIQAGDETQAASEIFRLANLRLNVDSTTHDRYRLWVGCDTKTKIIKATDGEYLTATGLQNQLAEMPFWNAGIPVRVERRRPPRAKLFDGRNATLEFSINYKGPVGALFDPGGDPSDWRLIPWGRGWELLDDRLGIRLTCDHPNAWNIGRDNAGSAENQVLKAITALANPNEANPPFFLRLTTAIEMDGSARLTGDGLARTLVFAARKYQRRDSSPLKHERYRHVTVGDDHQDWFLHESSPRFGDDANVVAAKDAATGIAPERYTGDKLDAYAEQVQQAMENPPVAGTVAIPWISEAYQVGDQIDEISGRGLSLCVNAGAEQGEAKRYPYVIGVDWGFANGQSTTLHLSDARAEPILR